MTDDLPGTEDTTAVSYDTISHVLCISTTAALVLYLEVFISSTLLTGVYDESLRAGLNLYSVQEEQSLAKNRFKNSKKVKLKV